VVRRIARGADEIRLVQNEADYLFRMVSALTGKKVAKDREYTGMESFWKAAMPFLTSARATSCGVDTITVPVWAAYAYEADVRAERNARTIDVDELSKRERYVARPGRHVYDEDVEAGAMWICASPVNVEEQLLHSLLHHETAPGHRCIGAGEQKPDGHGWQPMIRKWDEGPTCRQAKR
jgi:hypothetical protein